MTGNGVRTGAGHATRYDRWTYRTMNDRRMRRLHATAAQRRRVVAAHVVLTAVATAGLVLLSVTGRLWWTAALAGATLLWIPATAALNSMTRGLLELRARMLDERQLYERATVHALAHRVSFLAMLVAFAALAVAHGAGAGLSALAVPIAVTGLAVLVIHWLLPLWIAALRVEDDPEADDEPVLGS